MSATGSTGAGRVLVVGNATLDRIMELAAYPPEDAEVRALGARVEPGGNAANLARVLVALGHHARLATVFADEPDGRLAADLLQAAGVELSACLRRPGRHPVSQVWLARAGASRTIVHHRDLEEFPPQALPRPTGMDWVHFEGREPAAVREMLDRVAGERDRPPVSVEIEKPRPDIECLFRGPDVLFFSRGYARARGHATPEALLEAVAPNAPGALLVCAWGGAGAWLREPHGGLYHARAWRPGPVVDTLGAGDTFNAAFIDARLRGEGPARALEHAVRIAGLRCSLPGLGALAAALRGADTQKGESA